MSDNKIRTVFYAEPGARSFIQRILTQHNFKSESDVICYLIALGMKAHTKKMIDEVGNAHTE